MGEMRSFVDICLLLICRRHNNIPCSLSTDLHQSTVIDTVFSWFCNYRHAVEKKKKKLPLFFSVVLI